MTPRIFPTSASAAGPLAWFAVRPLSTMYPAPGTFRLERE
jgi:hypothetical protein